MTTAELLPAALAAQALDVLLQLHSEGDMDAVASFLAGLNECPDGAIHVFLPGLLAIAKG